MTISTKDLIPHPKNYEIYQDSGVEDLIDSIKKYGIQNPIIINSKNVIISGHRRWEAARKAGLKEVPVKVVKFKSNDDELKFLVIDNLYRSMKTREQRIREGKVLEEIYKKESKKRRQHKDVEEKDRGTTRDKVAKKVGLGSGVTYESGKKIVDKIDKLEKEGKKGKATRVRDKLKKSINKAKQEIVKIEKEEDPEVIVEFPEKKKPEKKPKKKEYDFTEDLASVLTVMRIARDRMTKNLRTKTIPEGLKKFLIGFNVFREQLESWLPQNQVDCPRCKGTNKVTVKGKEMTCVWCHRGKTGKYRGMEDV